MTKCLMTRIVLFCTGILRIWSQLHRVEDRDLFTEVCTRRIQRDIYSLVMGGSIIYGLGHLLSRRLTISHHDMYFAYFTFSLELDFLWCGCVHLIMQRPNIILLNTI
jgi:hypothetical protein